MDGILDLKYCEIGSNAEIMKYLIEIIKQHKSIIKLDFSHNSIGRNSESMFYLS